MDKCALHSWLVYIKDKGVNINYFLALCDIDKGNYSKYLSTGKGVQYSKLVELYNLLINDFFELSKGINAYINV